MSQTLLRCAIYTRVSSDQGLEQDFNSLDAQREAAEAYIKSQAHEGWRLRRDRYDDGGFSGGSMERPALARLLAAIRERRIDIVVVYKVDRLTRSLADFAKLVELFDSQKVSFVSVTQSFNTTSSMGRLTLNVLLSFAQFEREVTGERIRDKIAASKRKGIWMGGVVPMGYRVLDRKLVVDGQEAATVRMIFERYVALRSISKLVGDLRALGIVTRQRRLATGQIKGGVNLTNGPLAYMLKNRMYLGELNHRGQSFSADHPAIVKTELFDAVQAVLAANLGNRNVRKGKSEALLGLLFDDRGHRMSPSHVLKKGVRYRYYLSTPVVEGLKADAGSVCRVPASAIKQVVTEELRKRADAAVRTRAPSSGPGLSDKELLAHVARIELHPERLVVTLRESPDEVHAEGDRDQGQASPDEDSAASDAARTSNSFSIRWTPPSSHRRREILTPAEGPSSSNAKPLRNEERRKLLRAIALARSWHDELLSANPPETTTIAQRYGKTERWVRANLSLAFLDPKLVEAAVEGTLPRGYGSTRLFNLPTNWDEQWGALGLSSPRHNRRPFEA